jgi:hypothetical protein
MDRVCGPFKGYYVAVYACEMGELGQEYLGYYKVLRARPDSYWASEHCLLKNCVQRLTRSPDEAMLLAEEAALREIGNLPVLAELTRLTALRTGMHVQAMV